MTVPVFQAVGNQSAGTGAISVTWPAHLTGDLALLVVETSGEATLGTPAGGWTPTVAGGVADVASTAGSKLHVYWKYAASAAEATVSIADSGDHQIARIYTFRNVGNSEPFAGPVATLAITPAIAAGGTFFWPGVGSTYAYESLAVFIASRANDSNSTTNFAVASQNFTNNGAVINRGEGGSNAGNGGGFVVFTGNSILGKNQTHILSASTVLSTTTATYSILLRQKPELVHQNFHLKNWIENNTNVGAVAGNPGTLPTGWAFDGSGLITREVLGTGTQNGIPYVDIKFSSATSIGNDTVPCLTLHNTVAPITYGKSTGWLFGINLQVIDSQGVNNLKNGTIALGLIQNVGSGPQTLVLNQVVNNALDGSTSIPFTTRRAVSIIPPVVDPAEAVVGFRVRLDFSFGSPGYVTLRIGLPSLVQQAGTVETIEPIRTSGSSLEAPNANQFFTHVVVKRSAEVGTFTITGQPAEVKKTKYAITAAAGIFRLIGFQDSYRVTDNESTGYGLRALGIDIDPVSKRIYYTHRHNGTFRNFHSTVIEPNLIDHTQLKSDFASSSQLFAVTPKGDTVFSSQLGHAYVFISTQGAAGNPGKLAAFSLATPLTLANAYGFGYGDSANGRSIFSAATAGPDGSFYVSGRNDTTPTGGFLLKLNPTNFDLIWGRVTPSNDIIFQEALKVSGNFIYTLNLYTNNSDVRVTKRNTSDGSPSREVLLTSTFTDSSVGSNFFVDVDQVGNVYALLQRGGTFPILKIYKLDSDLNVAFVVNLLEYVPNTTDPGSNYDLFDLVTGFKVINDQNVLLTGVKSTVNQNVLIFNLDLSNENNILLKYINEIAYASNTTISGQIQQYDNEHFILSVTNGNAISTAVRVYKLKIDGSDVGSLDYSNLFTNLNPLASDPNTASYAGSVTSTSPISIYFKQSNTFNATIITNATADKTAFSGNVALADVTFIYKRRIKFDAEVGSYSVNGAAASLLKPKKLIAEFGSLIISGVSNTLFRGRNFNLESGSYNIVGQPATLAIDRVFGTFFGTYSITGQPAEFLTNLELNAEFGTYSISGQTVSVNRSVNSQSGSLILTGNDSTLAYGRIFNAESGSFVLSGQDATLTKVNKYILNVQNGHYATAGKEANLRFNPILIANIGYYEVLPQPSSLSYGRVFNLEVGSYAYSGNTADLYHYRVINAEQGSYTHSGQDANLVNDQNLNLESGSYSLTGQDVTLSKNKVLNSEFGVYSYSGQPANLRFDHQLNVDEGFYSVSGKNAGLYNNQNLNLESGSYNLTGQDADFIQALSFSVNQGSYNLSGQDSTLITDRVINAESGSLTVNGQSPYLSWHRIFELDLGVYTTVGQDADFIQTLSFGVNQGSYNLSGQDSSLVADKAINAESGSFILTGQSATQLLVKSIPAELGSYDITGQDADLDVRAADRTLIATPEQLTIEGQPITAVRTLVFIVESGSYDHTGQNANVSIGYKLQSDFGTLSIAGQNNAFIYDHVTLADFGAFSLSGSEANLSRTYQFTADFGSYSYAGSEALLSRSRQFLVDFGVYSSNGQDSLLSRTVLFNVDPEQYTLTGESALLIESLVLRADFGAYSLTGNDSQLTFNRVFTVEFGSYSISGQNSEFIQDLVFNAESGSTFLSGQEAYFYRGYSLNPEFGSFALTGQPANLANGRVLDSQFGEYAVNGQSSQFLRNYIFTAEFGEYITTGQPAFDIQAGKLNAQPGVYQLSGQDASLSQTDIFSAESGSYATVGQDTRLVHDQNIIAEHGIFATSGQDANLSKNFAIQAESGQYSVNGFDTDLDNDRILDADFTDYFITGQEADLSRIRRLNTLSGQIIVTGFDVSYYRTYALKSSVGNYDILGQDADIFQGAGAADPGQYGITGQYAFLVHNRILRAQSDNYTKSNWADPNYVDPNYAYGTDARLRVVRRVYPFSGSYSITGYPAVIDYDSVGELSDIIYKLLANRQELDPINGKFRIYDNDNVTILFESSVWADAEGTVPFSGGVLRRIDKLMPP